MWALLAIAILFSNLNIFQKFQNLGRLAISKRKCTWHVNASPYPLFLQQSAAAISNLIKNP